MRLSRRLILATLGVLVALGLGVAVGTPWLAQRAMTRVAQVKHWNLRASGGRIGLRGIWFDELRLDAGSHATIHGAFRDACIRWSSAFGKPSLSLGAGQLELIGNLDELRAVMRGTSDDGRSKGSRSSRSELDFYNLDANWRERADADPTIVATAIELHRSNGRLQLSVGGLRAARDGISLELKGIRASPADVDAAPEAPPYHVTAAELLAQYDASRVQSSSHTAQDAPATATQPQISLTASAAANPPKAKPTKPLAPKVPANETIHTGKKEVLPLLTWLFDEVERLHGEMTGGSTANRSDSPVWIDRIPSGTSFQTPLMRVRFVDLGQKLELGPWPLKADRRDDQLNVEVAQSADVGTTALAAKLTLVDRFERVTLRFAVGPVALPQLGVTDGDFGLENIASTRLGLDARAEYHSKTGELVVESKGRLEGLSIHQPFLSRETVRDLGFEWQGSATLDGAARRIKSEVMRISVGAVSARLSGSLELAHSYQVIDAKLDVPLAACQDLFSVLPDGLAPLLRGWRVGRNFALGLNVNFDSRAADKSRIGFQLDNNCRVMSVPPEASPTRFAQPFVLDVEDEQGNFQPTSFGPGTLNWTPIAAISPYIESAVLVCEDGRFLHHDGFDREAIQNSIRENLRAGRFVRGASTISMQLAKNLYLRRDKTIARKLQEAALTMLLEQSLSKRELLEIYLNVIEFGPGIYGIGPAAKHYFSTTPDRLTLAQAFFLMSILPSPKQRHFGSDGLVHAGRMKLLHSLMRIAQKRGHFSEAELESGLTEQLALGVPGNPALVPNYRIMGEPSDSTGDELSLPMPDMD